jgi:hypothetical protein
MSSATLSSRPWAARLNVGLIPALDRLRLTPGLEACVMGSWCWVRGADATSAAACTQAGVPWFNFYETASDGLLFEPGRTLPSAALPTANWEALASFLAPEAPAAAWPGLLRDRALFELRRASRAQAAEYLCLTTSVWHDFATSAPAIRLHPLKFVLNESKGLTLVGGRPLPSLPGQHCYARDGLIMPCGWEPGVDLQPATLAAWLRLGAGEMALLDENGTFSRIPATAWSGADRSVVRLNCGRGRS